MGGRGERRCTTSVYIYIYAHMHIYKYVYVYIYIYMYICYPPERPTLYISSGQIRWAVPLRERNARPVKVKRQRGCENGKGSSSPCPNYMCTSPVLGPKSLILEQVHFRQNAPAELELLDESDARGRAGIPQRVWTVAPGFLKGSARTEANQLTRNGSNFLTRFQKPLHPVDGLPPFLQVRVS